MSLATFRNAWGTQRPLHMDDIPLLSIPAAYQSVPDEFHLFSVYDHFLLVVSTEKNIMAGSKRRPRHISRGWSPEVRFHLA